MSQSDTHPEKQEWRQNQRKRDQLERSGDRWRESRHTDRYMDTHLCAQTLVRETRRQGAEAILDKQVAKNVSINCRLQSQRPGDPRAF
jgi:hypothetical protein